MRATCFSTNEPHREQSVTDKPLVMLTNDDCIASPGLLPWRPAVHSRDTPAGTTTRRRATPSAVGHEPQLYRESWRDRNPHARYRWRNAAGVLRRGDAGTGGAQRPA